ncbi:hypothetical protein GUJ93_ZPchr0008g12315 [Zizania palustris]|uniref:Uncharacterized protein n=1 Tax=Zizania palustris TaxID=103762 RepID=A0A8J5RGY0_ZIZPA|nr:hypothetical protein GUJ93_ZPchr0008g12315 [Zizania palustris]
MTAFVVSSPSTILRLVVVCLRIKRSKGASATCVLVILAWIPALSSALQIPLSASQSSAGTPGRRLRIKKCAMAKIKPKALLAQSKQKKGPSQIGPTTIITYIVLVTLVVSSVYAAVKYLRSRGPEAAEGFVGN